VGDARSVGIALIPSVFVVRYFWPRKSLKNLYVDAAVGHVNESFPIVVSITLNNHTNAPLYVLSEGFKFGSAIRGSPIAAKDAATEVLEIKFEGRETGSLSDIDTLIRPNQKVASWIPVDPEHSEESIKDALRERRVGVLRLRVQMVSTRPHPFMPLKIRL
jgi:hypothetical protein